MPYQRQIAVVCGLAWMLAAPALGSQRPEQVSTEGKEGRRARMGTSMMGPDYAQWHGFYQVAKHFYNEFLPEAERLQPGVSQSVLGQDWHRWKVGLKPEELKQILDFYRQRYKQ